MQQEELTKVYCISFNQSYDHFIVGTSIGFSVHQCFPYKLIVSHCILILTKAIVGGIHIAEMMSRSDMYALVGNKYDGLFPPTKVIIWCRL